MAKAEAKNSEGGRVMYGTELTLMIISAIKEHLIVWNKQYPNYKYPAQQAKAWNAIADSMGLTADLVTEKWENLRSQFRRNRQRVISSSQTGSASHSVYEPNWFGYEPMSFLLGSYDAGETEDTIRRNRSTTVPNQSSQPHDHGIRSTPSPVPGPSRIPIPVPNRQSVVGTSPTIGPSRNVVTPPTSGTSLTPTRELTPEVRTEGQEPAIQSPRPGTSRRIRTSRQDAILDQISVYVEILARVTKSVEDRKHYAPFIEFLVNKLLRKKLEDRTRIENAILETLDSFEDEE